MHDADVPDDIAKQITAIEYLLKDRLPDSGLVLLVQVPGSDQFLLSSNMETDDTITVLLRLGMGLAENVLSPVLRGSRRTQDKRRH